MLRPHRERTAAVRAQHEALIAGWTRQRRSLRWMAQALGIGHNQVKRDLDRLRAAWRADAQRDIALDCVESLAAAEELVAVAWDAYAASKGAETTVRERRAGPDGPSERVVVETASPAGNPAFLLTVLKGLDQRNRILGVYAATKAEVLATVQPPPSGEDDFDWAEYERRWRSERLGAGVNGAG
jgi:hypothetical protein